MNIQPVNDFKAVPHFKGRENSNVTSPKKEKHQQEKKGYSGTQVGGAVLATALSAAVLGGAVMRGKGQKVINSLYREKSILGRTVSNLEYEVKKGAAEIEDLTGQNKELNNTIGRLNTDVRNLKNRNNVLKEEVQKAKDKFQDIFEGDLAPKEVRDKIYNKYKSKIATGKLNYDVETPPVTGKSERQIYTDAIQLPKAGTMNRAGMVKLNIPEIAEDGRFDFKLPASDEVKITRMERKNIKSVQNQMTNITESYADSVQWNNDKIARDVLQNFYDGHGQTLDGVRMHFEPAANGKFKVRIEGDSTYTADKAVYIGESTKRGNAKAAGNYGEGLKMSVLKLLRDGGAEDVKIGSDNWKLTYKLQKGDLSDKRVLSYSLDNVDSYNGNYIEFETSDKGLLETFKKSINRFYHSRNPHFKCPDFENNLIGIKLLPKGEKGGIYIAGQRFEYDNDYDGLKGMALFIKEKPPVDILDPSRDRTSLNGDQIEKIARWLVSDCRMKNEDKAKLISALEPYWRKTGYCDRTPIDKFLEKFLSAEQIQDSVYKNGVHIQFPSKYVAYSNATDDVVRNLERSGYVVCKDDFASCGMQTIRDLIGDARAHDVVVPSETQTKKIMVLKEALKSLSDSLKGHFTPEELDTKIYLFDNKSPKDSKMYSSTLAEAITDKGTSKGFWIDKSYLDTSSLSEVLETALHELSHKAGGDESAVFSYKLTDVNKSAIDKILNDAKSRTELQALNRLWEELGM